MTERDGVAEAPAPSGTVTFLFTDIEGSTRRWDRDRAAMQEAVRLHDRLMRGAIAAHGGHVFKTVGDAFCAAFATPEAAAWAALDAQSALAAADFSAVDGLRVRMAINTGTADERDGDYFGPTVNRVARLLSLAHGGQVLLSGITANLVRENPPRQATLADLGEHALKDLGHQHVYQLVAPGLQRDFPELRAHEPRERPWLVPDAMRTRYFTGREVLFALIGRQLAERRRAALCGLGGVGKTQAAIEYAVRQRAEYPGGVFWISAETASGLNGGFVEIAKTVSLSAAESSDQEQAVRAVLEWFGGAERWLLILDNVDDRREVRRFVPDTGKGDVLITSREYAFAELGIPRALEVRDLDDDEALRFLVARTGREDDEPDERSAAAELAAELGNLPLALEQAAAYIAETSASFSGYLSAFRKRRVKLLERASGLVSRDTVAVTWSANFEAVERASAAAADVLRISAFLAPDAIPFEVFSKGAEALGNPIAEADPDPDELTIAELVRPLTRYSLIRSDAKVHAYGVHRLVQEIVRAAIAEGDHRGFVERSVGALRAAFPEVEYATWAQCDRLVPHVTSIAGWVESLDMHPAAGSDLFSRAGRYLIERGRYAEAQPLVERALAIAERSLRPDHPDMARYLHNLGLVHYYQSRLDVAEPLYKRALAIRERALGPDHADVAVTLNNIANVYFMLGRYAESQPLYERTLAIWERAHGPDHPSVATGHNNLGEALARQGRYDEALPLLERGLAIRERTLGPGHPHVALSFSNLGEVYWRQGRLSESEAMHERALAIRERALGPDHDDVATSLNGLALVYEGQGRYAEAQPLYERALAISERTVGGDHPQVADSLDGLASLGARRRDDGAAEALYERALAIRERALGSEHVDIADSLVGLASLRRAQGRNADAVPLLERALAIKERVLAAGHPQLVEIRRALDALRAEDAPSAD